VVWINGEKPIFSKMDFVALEKGVRGGKVSHLTPSDERCIALFRGHPRDPVQKRWEPKNMDSLIARALQEFSVLETTTPETEIRDHWLQIMGEAWAAQSVPARITRDGTLIVLVANPILRQEISFQKRAILKKIRNKAGCRHIRNLLLRGG